MGTRRTYKNYFNRKRVLLLIILFHQNTESFARLDSRIQRRNGSKGEQNIGNL